MYTQSGQNIVAINNYFQKAIHISLDCVSNLLSTLRTGFFVLTFFSYLVWLDLWQLERLTSHNMAAFLYTVALSLGISAFTRAQEVINDEADDIQDQARGFRDSCHDESTLRPNFVMIMLDDLGFGDISATTGQFPTPNMDILYLHGIQLSHHYVHLMCSPSRTQFITGRYAMNLGFGEFLPWNNLEAGGIPIGQPTLANWLSEYGDYTTYGVGKWHMGTCYNFH